MPTPEQIQAITPEQLKFQRENLGYAISALDKERRNIKRFHKTKEAQQKRLAEIDRLKKQYQDMSAQFLPQSEMTEIEKKAQLQHAPITEKAVEGVKDLFNKGKEFYKKNLKEFVEGTPERFLTYKTVTPEQEAFSQRLLGLIEPNLQKEIEYYQKEREKSPLEQILGFNPLKKEGEYGSLMQNLLGGLGGSVLSGYLSEQGGPSSQALLGTLLGSLVANKFGPQAREYTESTIKPYTQNRLVPGIQQSASNLSNMLGSLGKEIYQRASSLPDVLQSFVPTYPNF